MSPKRNVEEAAAFVVVEEEPKLFVSPQGPSCPRNRWHPHLPPNDDHWKIQNLPASPHRKLLEPLCVAELVEHGDDDVRYWQEERPLVHRKYPRTGRELREEPIVSRLDWVVVEQVP